MGCKGCIKGAIGIGKVLAGIDLVPSTETVRRLAICDKCEYGLPCAQDKDHACKCSICKCVLSFKTRLASEHCPDARW